MYPYQRDFLQFALAQGVLRFGDFTLKSGRISPYFFNAGLFNTGATLQQLGQFYAQAIKQSGIEFDTLFGPAYKGIPLVTATAMSLAAQQQDKPWCFNRKESKDHGEGGVIVGAPLSGKVLLVDDVITAGTAMREAIQIIQAHQAQPIGVVIALDRQELGQDQRSAIQELEQDYGLQVIAIARLAELIDFVAEQQGLQVHLAAIQAYQNQYGIKF